MTEWFRLEKNEIEEKLATNFENGLSNDAIARKLEQHGPNELIDRGSKSPWKILWEQLTGIMVIILIISAAISLALGEVQDAIVILVIVVLNTLLGFTQEYKAERAMAALKQLAVPHVKVRRGGHVVEVSARELVPGDIVLLEAGNAVPADARILESVNLRALEAVLTGESEAVEKISDALTTQNPPIGDRINSLYMGTVITYGRGSAVVTDTGMNTQLGKIAEMIQSVGSESTPLQRRLEQLGKGLAIAALAIVAVVFVLGILRGEEIRLMFQTSISMAVAAIPEGLAAVVTIALALGAQRMLKRRALIRKLPAVETLGSVTVICSDKTGTLTENRMTVTVLDVAGHSLDFSETVRSHTPSITGEDAHLPVLIEYPAVALLITGGALCNDALLEPAPEDAGGFSTIGDPTEGALVIAGARSGLWKAELEKALPRVSELPFDSDRKRMTTVHSIDHTRLPAPLKPFIGSDFSSPFIAITKGSVDGLIDISSRVWVNNEIRPLDQDWRDRIMATNNGMAQKGMRVLGVAFHLRNDAATTSLEQDLIFVGMFGMIDPARPEVKDAVATAKSAGIRTIMITGDHPLTALHIAKDLGITEGDRVLTGRDLAEADIEQIKQNVHDVNVYARVSPEHKLKIVQALQEMGHVVAMTGDGVNDAPALKKADIGVAMGITGTDVSKEASDMVLLDDNFSTIVAAVEEGRRIYDNILKFLRYILPSNAGEIFVMLAAPFAGMPMPLSPIQILWINLVTDGLPGLALTTEPSERSIMKRPPISQKINIFGQGLGRDVLWIGLLIGIVSLATGFFFWKGGGESWHTIVFTTLTMAQMGNALASRSQRDSLFTIGLFSNPALLGSILLTVVLQLAVIYIPFLQNIFDTTALTLSELLISIGAGSLVFIAIEIVKWVSRRRNP